MSPLATAGNEDAHAGAVFIPPRRVPAAESYDIVPHQLSCPLCKATAFRKEKGKMDSRWGFTAHRIDLRVCERCGFVMSFWGGRTFWGDFD